MDNNVTRYILELVSRPTFQGMHKHPIQYIVFLNIEVIGWILKRRKVLFSSDTVFPIELW